MNRFIPKKNAPQAYDSQNVKSFHQEFQENKQFMQQFIVDCVISIMGE
jgi:hypothetical protein